MFLGGVLRGFYIVAVVNVFFFWLVGLLWLKFFSWVVFWVVFSMFLC